MQSSVLLSCLVFSVIYKGRESEERGVRERDGPLPLTDDSAGHEQCSYIVVHSRRSGKAVVVVSLSPPQPATQDSTCSNTNVAKVPLTTSASAGSTSTRFSKQWITLNTALASSSFWAQERERNRVTPRESDHVSVSV